MGHLAVGTRYPPNIFNDSDDDEDRSLKSVFHAVFDATNPLDLELAAKQIDAYYPMYTEEQYKEMRRQSDDEQSSLKAPENFVWWILSDFFVPLAKQLAFDHPFAPERLVELLRMLCSLPAKPTRSHPMDGENVWMAHSFADLRNTVQYEFNGELLSASLDSSADKAAHEEARNFNAWTALLYARGIGNHSLYAIWCIRNALEKDEAKLGNALEQRVLRAADWIKIAGPKLSTCGTDNSSPTAGDELWQGQGGFSEERWKFWRTRFERMAGLSSLRQVTRDAATAAARHIDWID